MQQICNQKVQDILLKYKKPIYEIFETEVQPINYQISLYTDFQDIQYHISALGFDKKFNQIYGINGFDISVQNEQKLKIYLIKIIEEEIIKSKKFKGITIIFFNKAETSHQKSNLIEYPITFTKFKKLIKGLSLKYFARINQVYLCFPDFGFSSFHIFKKEDILNQLLDVMVVKISSLVKLVQKLGPLFKFQDIDKKIVMIDKSLEYMFVYSEREKKQAMQKMSNIVSQVQYPESIEIYQTYEDTNIPKILVLICQHFKNNDKCCKTEYIFRKSCASSQLKKIEQLTFQNFDQEKYRKQLHNFDSITLATFIKRIFSQLQTPLFNFQTYQMIIKLYSKQQNQQEQLQICPNSVFCSQIMLQSQSLKLDQVTNTNIKQIQIILANMEEINRQIFFYVIYFLRDYILKYEHYNMMSPYSLAVTFAPTFFRSRKANFQQLIDSQKIVRFLDSFLNKGMIINIDF